MQCGVQKTECPLKLSAKSKPFKSGSFAEHSGHLILVPKCQYAHDYRVYHMSLCKSGVNAELAWASPLFTYIPVSQFPNCVLLTENYNASKTFNVHCNLL
jgi:hypothetical protein